MGETWPGPGAQRSPGRTGAPVLKFLRPLLVIYGTGIAGTFAWLFFALSGTSACAAGRQSCQMVLGLTGQLSLIWPAYWGGRIAGEPTVATVVPIEALLVAVLVFLVVLALAQAYVMLGREEPGTAAERKQTGPARNEPLIKTSEPNRRNQSRPSRLAQSGGP